MESYETIGMIWILMSLLNKLQSKQEKEKMEREREKNKRATKTSKKNSCKTTSYLAQQIHLCYQKTESLFRLLFPLQISFFRNHNLPNYKF